MPLQQRAEIHLPEKGVCISSGVYLVCFPLFTAPPPTATRDFPGAPAQISRATFCTRTPKKGRKRTAGPREKRPCKGDPPAARGLQSRFLPKKEPDSPELRPPLACV